MHYPGMYLDGGSLADQLREKPSQRIREFLKGIPRDAHFLSSLINCSINDTFYKLHYNTNAFINERMRYKLAHASKHSCSDIAPGQIVLCIYKHDRGDMSYREHEAGKCPHIMNLLDEFKRLFPHVCAKEVNCVGS